MVSGVKEFLQGFCGEGADNKEWERGDLDLTRPQGGHPLPKERELGRFATLGDGMTGSLVKFREVVAPKGSIAYIFGPLGQVSATNEFPSPIGEGGRVAAG